jgi:hypothetical protein
MEGWCDAKATASAQLAFLDRTQDRSAPFIYSPVAGLEKQALGLPKKPVIQSPAVG